jgi:hypothetical protein
VSKDVLRRATDVAVGLRRYPMSPDIDKVKSFTAAFFRLIFLLSTAAVLEEITQQVFPIKKRWT